MYHRFRALHRWIGFIASVCLLLIAATGFLLATKASVDWIRPTEKKGEPLTTTDLLVPIDTVANAAFAVGIPELKSIKDVDRIDYRPKSNLFKVVSKEGYHEVQVDGNTGKVLNVAKRNDQFIEDLHDFTWFHDLVHKFGLPVVALGLFFLAASGIGIFLVPVVRRAKHRRSQIAKKP